jgi:hypothetical protein
MQQNHHIPIKHKQHSGNACAQSRANLPDTTFEMRHQWHTQGPPELNGLDVFAYGLSLSDRQILQPITNWLATGIRPVKPCA